MPKLIKTTVQCPKCGAFMDKWSDKATSHFCVVCPVEAYMKDGKLYDLKGKEFKPYTVEGGMYL